MHSWLVWFTWNLANKLMIFFYMKLKWHWLPQQKNKALLHKLEAHVFMFHSILPIFSIRVAPLPFLIILIQSIVIILLSVIYSLIISLLRILCIHRWTASLDLNIQTQTENYFTNRIKYVCLLSTLLSLHPLPWIYWYYYYCCNAFWDCILSKRYVLH